jgi:hypothetical protein
MTMIPAKAVSAKRSQIAKHAVQSIADMEVTFCSGATIAV